MKKIFLFLPFVAFIAFFISFNFASSDECNYAEQIKICEDSQDSPRSIDDFVCISWNKAEMVYQIVLDDKFSEIDLEMDNYLSSFEEDKDRYFWKNAEKSYIDWINEIIELFWVNWKYYNKFLSLCGWPIIKETQACLWWSVPIKETLDFFKESTCMDITAAKLDVYRSLAFDILKLNKAQVRKDEEKTYVQQERKKYDELLDAMMINLWYVQRIWKKWTLKLRNPL